MDDSGATEDLYSYIRWDADLIPSNPFTSYVKRQTQGYNLQDVLGETYFGIPVPDEDFPARPVQLVSETTWHAFTAVGSSDEDIWLHDTSGAFTGGADIAQQMSWADFRSIAIDNTQTEELHTMIINASLRPANERRGSIELSEGTNAGYLRFVYDGVPRMHWQWDGDPWQKGYFWDDPSLSYSDDPVYGNVAEILNGTLEYEIRVNNVTQFDFSYDLTVELRRSSDDAVIDSNAHTPFVTSYSRGSYINDSFGPFDTYNGVSAGEYYLFFQLSQNGVTQDFKTVSFKLE